jgi:hypothetical protein
MLPQPLANGIATLEALTDVKTLPHGKSSCPHTDKPTE